MMLFATAYNPPIHYVALMRTAGRVMLDTGEHFRRQTLRSRCHILGPNGVETLIIPLVHGRRTDTPIGDIRIANDLSWQQHHWRTLKTAYGRAAFYDYIADELAPLYSTKETFLFDFNLKMIQTLMNMMRIKTEILLSPPGISREILPNEDFRYLSDPKIPLLIGTEKKYPQVFSYKFGFVGGLGVLDSLFNLGPSAVQLFSQE